MNDATDPVDGALLSASAANSPGGQGVDGAGETGSAAGLSQAAWDQWAALDPVAAAAAWRDLQGVSGSGGAEGDAEVEQRLAAAHAELERDIEGWSPELADEIAAYARARGFTAEEVAGVEDPREVKILHLAMLGEQALAQQAHERAFGRFRPPTTVGGRGHPRTLSDRTSADAWMQARRNQLRKKARG